MEKIKEFILGLNPSYVGIAAFIMMLTVVALVTILINGMIKSKAVKDRLNFVFNKSAQTANKALTKSKLKAFNYEQLEMYINRSGLAYMTNYKITPLKYMICKMGFAIFFMLIGLSYSIMLGVIAMVVGWFIMDIIVQESDKSDNKNILDDIKNVYDTLKIQTKAGVYITSVLTDCYLIVQNKRLKDAFLKLTSDIVATNDAEESLDKFRNKFNNEYIDTLVVIIKQSLQTGQASKMFDDIRNQINDIEAAIAMQEKNRIQTLITICEILLYAAIIIIAIYIALVALSEGLTF